MRNKAILITAMSFIALSLYADGAKLHNKMGIGYSASVTTTPTEFIFEQTPSAELISTGDFASDTNWTKGAGWTIGSGVATYTTNAASTNTLTQGSLSLTSNEEYRVTYTITAITNATVTPSFGNETLTARTATGTFVEDVTYFGTAQLQFSIVASGATTSSIDNVSIYQKPEAAYVDYLSLSSTSGAATVYFNFNCTAAQFTNLYLRSKTMQLIGGTPLELPAKSPVYNIWYRTASGSETAIINAL